MSPSSKAGSAAPRGAGGGSRSGLLDLVRLFSSFDIVAYHTGAALQEATRQFHAGRETFRQIFIDLLNQHKLDAMLYPANHARPHTHEGGLERYGSEPGTCEESAATGLPQVTVPAGFIGGRYPVGISLLGRMWDDKRLLELAAAYERATHHRRPPTTVK